MRQNLTLVEAELVKKTLAMFCRDMAKVSDIMDINGMPEEVALASLDLMLAVAVFGDIIENNAQ